MWLKRWNGRASCALLAAFGLGACLPAGDAPAGRQVVHGRTLSGVFLSPSEQEGVPSHLLASGEPRAAGGDWANEVLVDLHLLDAERAQPLESADLLPTIRDMQVPGGNPAEHTVATDHLGRLLYVGYDASQGSETPFTFWRFDVPASTGAPVAAIEVGRWFESSDPRLGARPFLLSAGRTQVYAWGGGEGWLLGPGSLRSVRSLTSGIFVGDALYCSGYLALAELPNVMRSAVVRIRPDAEPETLFMPASPLALVPVGQGTKVILAILADTGRLPFALFDTETLETVAFPNEKGPADFVSASSDERWLLFRKTSPPPDGAGPPETSLFIYTWSTGWHDAVDGERLGLAAGESIGANSEWRPGTTELWIPIEPTGFFVWNGGADLTRFHGTLHPYRQGLGAPSFFTPDGRSWFSRELEARIVVRAGSASDPAAARVRLNPPGTDTTRYWPVPDGRLLVEAWATSPLRNDIYLVDPAVPSSRAIGTAGTVLAVGHTRALALVNIQLSRSTGDLVLADYASSAEIHLGSDVYAADVDRGVTAAPSGADRLAPGARVAFLTRHRLESPDDGLWVAHLP